MNFEQGDIIGKSGLEEVLEKEIRGTDGVQLLQVDAHGRETFSQTLSLYGDQVREIESTPGYSTVLTIDKALQDVAYKNFSQQQRTGGVIAMKSNGEVLAWISSPSFDPNEFASGISPQIWSKLINDQFKPLRNKVIQDYFAPGSTFKAFMGCFKFTRKSHHTTDYYQLPRVFTFWSS